MVKASKGQFKEVVIVEEVGTLKDEEAGTLKDEEGSTTYCGETGFQPQLFHAVAVQERKSPIDRGTVTPSAEGITGKNPPLMQEQSPPTDFYDVT